ncbi:MAG: Maf family protein [candidate division Zixibacteria bacterium]|nr:Maf family protein [candidate division Zixibacteria bacterium]
MTLLTPEGVRLGRELESILGDRTLILASSSPRRRQILTDLNLKFKVVIPPVEEYINSASPHNHVKKWALLKAQSVNAQFKSSIVVGADTIVVLNDKILGKPKDRTEAAHMLKRLSGNTHTVLTGVAAINTDDSRQAVEFEATRVSFNHLSQSQIENYLDKNEYADKAGAYGIQGMEKIFLKKLSGSLDNVIGLPVKTLTKVLREIT